MKVKVFRCFHVWHTRHLRYEFYIHDYRIYMSTIFELQMTWLRRLTDFKHVQWDVMKIRYFFASLLQITPHRAITCPVVLATRLNNHFVVIVSLPSSNQIASTIVRVLFKLWKYDQQKPSHLCHPKSNLGTGKKSSVLLHALTVVVMGPGWSNWSSYFMPKYKL